MTPHDLVAEITPERFVSLVDIAARSHWMRARRGEASGYAAVTRYEDACRDWPAVAQRWLDWIPALGFLPLDSTFHIHGRAPSPIVDQNPHQYARMRIVDFRTLARTFVAHLTIWARSRHLMIYRAYTLVLGPI